MKGRVHVGVGGWSFPAWRGTFYPERLPRARELAWASRALTSIEINVTFYRAQRPETFARWREETPDGFVFAVKAPRAATGSRPLAGAGEAIERFLRGGVQELGEKLGPIDWQLPPGHALDLRDLEAFVRLLPRTLGGRPLRHAIEFRHRNFRDPQVVALLREHGVAAVVTGDSRYPSIPDLTAPFVYARIMGTTASEPLGYSSKDLDVWTRRAKDWAAGGVASGLPLVSPLPADARPRNVFLFVVRGAKERNPAAARALVERVASPTEQSRSRP